MKGLALTKSFVSHLATKTKCLLDQALYVDELVIFSLLSFVDPNSFPKAIIYQQVGGYGKMG